MGLLWKKISEISRFLANSCLTLMVETCKRLFPCPSQKFVNQDGMEKFLFLNLQDHQPGTPQHPGDPGLFFDTEPNCIKDYLSLIVITRVEMKLACLWQVATNGLVRAFFLPVH